MLPYLLHVPEGEPPADGWPFALFLHGIGERGRGGQDLGILESTTAPLTMLKQGWRPPLVLLAPQCPPTTWWVVDDVIALLDQVLEQVPADPARVHLTGLSMGGHGAWAVAATQPARFASLAPICGPELQSGPWDWEGMARIPTWVFHGDADSVVDLEHSRRMVRRLEAAGGSPRLTVYPGVWHDCWTQAYGDPALWEWMLAQRTPQPGPV